MVHLRKVSPAKKKRTKASTQREFVFSQSEQQLLKRIGLKINHDLYEQSKPVEWLALKLGVARSTLREIIAGRSNFRVLTLNAIAEGLGYRGLADFLKGI